MARMPDLEAFIREYDLKICSVEQIIQHRLENGDFVSHRETSIKLPLDQGEFDGHLYSSHADQACHLALTMGIRHPAFATNGNTVIKDPVLVRVHSECLTGDVFGSNRCDCGAQKDRALELIAEEGQGILLYLRQEGRGIGLSAKLKAYALQDEGLDTVEANVRLGYPPDARLYGVGAQILYSLGVRKVRLLTNNPEKCEALQAHGLEVVERIPLEIQAHCQNRFYLKTKREKLGHILSDKALD